MRVLVAAVGRVKEPGLREVVDDYLGRIRRYGKADEVEIRDGAAAEVEARFRKVIPARSRLVALEVGGRPLSSDELARYVGRAQNDGISAVVFAIGGAYGLPPAVSRLADLRLSLSAMTLPHRLARVVLVEQVYRAFTILRNEPYSH